MRAFDLAAGIPWAIQEEMLQTILEIASRTNALTPEALSASLGRPLSNDREETVVGSTAVIPVVGPIMRRANLFSSLSSGATSTERLAADFRAALEDPKVQSIILNIDSPGGEANGISELAGMIYAARGQKPITAYISGIGASGAYWIAAAADEIVCNSTSIIGSIGVAAAYRDLSSRDAQEGVRNIEFVSSQSPNKRPDPTSQSGWTQIQAMVDALAEVFVADVAQYRGVTKETVLSDFGQGGVFVGQAAINAGMADRMGTLESVLTETAERVTLSASSFVLESASPGGKEPKMNLWEQMKAALGGGDAATETATDAVQAQMSMEAATALKAKDQEIERLKSAAFTAQTERIQTDATTFAEAEIAAQRSIPAERAAIISAFTIAATDDALHPTAVMFGEGKTGSRVDALKAAHAARTPHHLTSEMVPSGDQGVLFNRVQADDPNKEKPLTTERRAELLSMTDLGRAALKNGKGA